MASFSDPDLAASLQAKFQQAEALHRQGRLADAERLYGEIRRHDPNHFGALHLSGLLACQTQRTELGLQLIKMAIAVNPTAANAHNNLGNALFGLNQIGEALKSYDAAIMLEPDHARAHCNRGAALRSLNRPQEALASCNRATVLDPNLAEAYCNRGNALVALNRSQDALVDFDRAIALRAAYPEAHCNRGTALLELGRIEDALASVDQALALRRHYPEAHSNRGNILSRLKRFDEALVSYDRALALRPTLAAAWLGRGHALAELERFDEAVDAYQRALTFDDAMAEAWLGRANAFVALGRHQDALADYDRALALKSDRVGIVVSRGNVLLELKRYEEAGIAYQQALALEPRFAGAWLGRGNLFYALKRYQEADAAYDQAIQIKPDLDGAWLGRANSLREQGRYDEAARTYEKTLQLNPDLAEAWVSYGVMHQELMQLDRAQAAYEKAISLNKNLADAQFNKALLLLLRGDYAEGWKLYEWRWSARDQRQYRRQFAQPLWLGNGSLAGKSILLYSEQGFGDAIQFCRYAATVSELGGRVILEAPQPLVKLFSSLQGVTMLIARGNSLPNFDCHCPLLSLPLALGSTLSNIPSPGGYLKAERQKREFWRDKFGEKAKLRVGLVWSSGFHPDQPELWRTNERRNISLTHFAAFCDVAAEFYSLQKGPSAGPQLGELIRGDWGGPAIIDYTPDIADFSDTAALMENLDLVISVDTAAAHLAGALGRPVWVLSRFDPDWRWHLDRRDSSWYSSARIYRQTRRGEWSDVVQRVRQDLLELCRSA